MDDVTHPAAASLAADRPRGRGMGLFAVVWSGQVVSALGTALSSFALGVEVFRSTGSVTRFGFVAVAMIVPNLLFSPIAGVLADRFDRRRLLIGAHVGSALCTLALLRLVIDGRIEAWHVYPVVFASATFSAFVWPTFTAATTLIVGRDDLDRAAGMNQLGTALSQLVAPLAAGALLVTIGLRGVIAIDIVTFVLATVVLLLVRFPQPTSTAEGRDAGGSFGRQLLFGWHYIRDRPGLVHLLLLAAGLRASVALVQTLITPLVLSFASPVVLGLVLSIAAAGMLVGSIAVSVWGAPERRIETILWVMVAQGLLLMLGGLRPSLTLIASAAFCFMLGFPLVVAASQAIWQAKVAVDLQGRVFATRLMVSASLVPLGLALAGPLGDRFERAMAPGGLLAGVVGDAIGVGPGRGIGLLLMLAGGAILALAAVGFRLRRLRGLERELPDAEGVPDLPSVAARHRPAVAGWRMDELPAALVLIGLAAAAVAALALQRPPAAVPASAPADTFSAARAWRHVEALAARPRPSGSPAHAAARAYLVAELEDLGLEVTVQRTRDVTAARGVVQVVDVANVLARLPGTAAAADTVLLTAHYDSVLGSPGAADAAAGVAALLETARALVAGPPRRNDLLFLLTDGEETGLHGARAFVDQHPRARAVDVALSFEARGRGGPSMMFRTGPGNGWWIERYFDAVRRPAASSLMGQIYRRLPNDTDLSVFLEAGLPGYDFAFIEGLTHYHTALDRPEYLDRRSVQHHGDQASSLAAHLADLDLGAAPPGGDRTYFDVLGRWSLRYGGSTAAAVALAALVVAGAALRRGLQRGKLTVFGLAQGCLIYFAVLVTVTVAITLAWLVIRDLADVAVVGGSTAGAGRFMAAFACLALAGVLLAFDRCRRLTAGADLAAGALLWWMLLVVLTAGVVLPLDSGFLFSWPLLFAGLGLLWSFGRGRRRWPPVLQAAVLGATLVPGIVLVLPFTAAVYTGLQGLAQLGGLGLVPGLLLLGLLYPLFDALPAAWPGRLAAFAALAGAAMVAWALSASIGADAVRADSVLYAEDQDRGTGRWLSFDPEPDDWTVGFGFAAGVVGPVDRFFPLPLRDLMQADAPYAELTPPALAWTELAPDGGARRFRIDFENPAPSRARLLWFEPEEAVTAVRLDGQALPVRGADGRPHERVLRLLGSRRPETLEVTVAGGDPVRLVVVEQRIGLPAAAGVAPRPPSLVPRPLFVFLASDVSLVRRSVVLEGAGGSVG